MVCEPAENREEAGPVLGLEYSWIIKSPVASRDPRILASSAELLRAESQTFLGIDGFLKGCFTNTPSSKLVKIPHLSFKGSKVERFTEKNDLWQQLEYFMTNCPDMVILE